MQTLLITILSSGVLSILGMLLADRFLTERIAIAGSLAGLHLSHNPGVAFGISFAPFVQMALILAALLAIVWMSRNVRSFLQQIAYGLILGGGIANIIDRLPDGLVTDYFQIGTFPVFNVADSCITIGVLILILEMLVWRRRKM